MKGELEDLHANERSLMGDWETKGLVTEEWLDNVAQEISVYCEPENNIDDFEDYLSKFDVSCSFVITIVLMQFKMIVTLN